MMNKSIRPYVGFFCLTACLSCPTLAAWAWYSHYNWNRPPTFPGDPDIGWGLVMLVAMANGLFLLIGWALWFAWWSIRHRARHTN